MAPAKKAAKKAPAKKAPAKKAAKKAPAKKAAKKAPAKKAGAKKAPAKKAGAKKATSGGGDRPMLLSKSKIKETLKGHGKRTDSSLIHALNEEIHKLLERATKRADDNKRGTVRPGDL